MVRSRLASLSFVHLALSTPLVLSALSGLSAGCFYDSSWGARKSAQLHNASRATPAALTSSAEPEARASGNPSGAITLHVRVHATPAYAAQTPDWKSHVASLLAQASTTLEASVGAGLVLDAADPWEHVGASRLDGDLTALREEDTGDGADLVLGFIGGLPMTTQDFDQLGLSELPGKHLVLRAPNVAGEYAAIEKAFDELSAEARTRLRRERIRHREVAVLLHEVGHALGAEHQSVDGSLMRPAYDAKMSEFDAESVARIKRRLAHASEPAKGPEPAASVEAAKPEVQKKDDAPPELRGADQELWRRSADLVKAGDAQGAWSAARPLFSAYPLVYRVQDLRCKLAMATLGSYADVRKECDALMALSMKDANAK